MRSIFVFGGNARAVLPGAGSGAGRATGDSASGVKQRARPPRPPLRRPAAQDITDRTEQARSDGREPAAATSSIDENNTPARLKEPQIDVFLFDKQSVILRRVALRLSDIRPGHRPKVVLFDLADLDCGSIGRLLVNGSDRLHGGRRESGRGLRRPAGGAADTGGGRVRACRGQGASPRLEARDGDSDVRTPAHADRSAA